MLQFSHLLLRRAGQLSKVSRAAAAALAADCGGRVGERVAEGVHAGAQLEADRFGGRARFARLRCWRRRVRRRRRRDAILDTGVAIYSDAGSDVTDQVIKAYDANNG